VISKVSEDLTFECSKTRARYTKHPVRRPSPQKEPNCLGRRAFGLGAFLLAATSSSSCTRARDAREAHPTVASALPSLKLGAAIELYSWFDLPSDDPRSRELSGLSWDAKENVLYAVQDDSPYIVRLIPDPKVKTWSFGEQIKVSCDFTLDLEGLVSLPDHDGFLIASEAGPRVFEVDRAGHHRRDLTIPDRFRDSRDNKSLESLTMSPGGRYLFTTTEVALTRDGPTPSTAAGTRVRIACMDRGAGARETAFNTEVSEFVYETDPTPTEGSDWGVSDLAALSETDLLVLERGWKRGFGNTIRIYQTSIANSNAAAGAACMGKSDLAQLKPLPKTLRVDVGNLEVAGCPMSKQAQPNPILDNFEGLTLGPVLPDGRKSLILISDDNAHDNQVARILVLAL
jgi:hypothetical protein